MRALTRRQLLLDPLAVGISYSGPVLAGHDDCVAIFNHEKSLGDSARVNVRCGLNLRVNDINLH
jgi:hypothetical protein